MTGFLSVLDASALLAVLHGERGADVVKTFLDGAAMSAVNWSETVQKVSARGLHIHGLRTDVEAVGVTIVPFDSEQAEAAASLWRQTRSAGLSLGDRACLVLASRLGLPAITADRSWDALHIGVDVRVVR